VAGGDTLWSSAPFVNRGERTRRYQDDVGRSVLIIFKIFAGPKLVSRKILLFWAGTIESNGIGSTGGDIDRLNDVPLE